MNEISKKRIWIDVTELMRWVGPVTGIQRVNLCYSLYAIILYKNIELVSFDRVTKKYKIVNKKQFVARFVKYVDEKDFEKYRSKFNYDIIYLMKLFISYCKTKVPLKWRGPLLKIKRKVDIVRDTLIYYTKMILKVNKIKAPFSDNDILLVLGSSWGKEKLNDIFLEIKSDFKIKIGHIVFDLIPIVRPQYFDKSFESYFEEQLTKAVIASDILIPISKSTENDLNYFCKSKNLGVKKTYICRLGDDISQFNTPEPVEKLINQKFILSVGTLEIRKNHKLLIDCWKDLYPKLKNDLPILVIVGRHGWLIDDLIAEINENPILVKKVLWLQNTTDDELAWLYNHCLFTVYPSHYEGWGLPVAESLALGKHCIASNSSSIPEIGGDLIDYISSTDAASLKNLIIKYVQYPNLIAEKELLIKSEYKTTSWADSTSEMINHLNFELK